MTVQHLPLVNRYFKPGSIFDGLINIINHHFIAFTYLQLLILGKHLLSYDCFLLIIYNISIFQVLVNNFINQFILSLIFGSFYCFRIVLEWLCTRGVLGWATQNLNLIDYRIIDCFIIVWVLYGSVNDFDHIVSVDIVYWRLLWRSQLLGSDAHLDELCSVSFWYPV